MKLLGSLMVHMVCVVVGRALGCLGGVGEAKCIDHLMGIYSWLIWVWLDLAVFGVVSWSTRAHGWLLHETLVTLAPPTTFRKSILVAYDCASSIELVWLPRLFSKVYVQIVIWLFWFVFCFFRPYVSSVRVYYNFGESKDYFLWWLAEGKISVPLWEVKQFTLLLSASWPYVCACWLFE